MTYSSPARRDPATLPTVPSNVKAAGQVLNPVLATVAPATSHAGGKHL